MTPSFMPKEQSKRKLEKKAVLKAMEEKKKIQAAKDLAEKIAKAYRKDREEKWPWDQHDSPKREIDAKKLAREIYLGMKRAELERAAEIEKRPKKKRGGLKIGRSSTIEGISEAIGNKFKEMMERKSDKQKKSTSTDSRKPKPIAGEKTNSQSKTPSNKERRERLGPKVKMKTPEVRGEKITTKQRLRGLVNEEYSSLKKKKDFPQRMKETEVHQDLMKKYSGKERIKHGEITKIAKELGVDRETVSNWITKGMNPRLYTYMNWSTPESDATERVRKLQENNNGIRNAQDVQKRFDSYYLGKNERASHFYKRELRKMNQYFEFLEISKQGGMHLDNAKEARLSESGARDYLSGGRPWLVRLAVQIPAKPPKEGHKWLPKTAGRHAIRDDWIQVREKITDCKQVMDVVKQLKPLDNEDMRRWELKYGRDYSPEERFMHLLGTYVSDSNVPSASTSSIAFGMNLSKGYEWSWDYGEASCYHLGKIGIRAHRVSDVLPNVSRIMTPYGEKRIEGKEQYHWMSENSPVLRWIRRSCLGYNETAKTYQEVNAKWILNAPENLRSAFLQGYSDGDGGVSSRGYYFTISTHSDHDFVEKLLGSFGVDTYRSKTYVRTAGFSAVRKAEKIPPFKYATDRQEALEKTVQMIESRKTSWKSNPPLQDEMNFMNDLRQKGLSYGAIGEKVFDKYGYTLDARDVRRIILELAGKKKWKKGV